MSAHVLVTDLKVDRNEKRPRYGDGTKPGAPLPTWVGKVAMLGVLTLVAVLVATNPAVHRAFAWLVAGGN